MALAALLPAACGSDGGGEATSASLPAGCQEAQKPPPKRVKLKGPRQTLDRSQKLVATVDTSCGSFEIALDTGDSPKTVSSFVYLADQRFYDDTTIHRIVPGFVIQGGDQLGTGRGGPGYSVDEPPPSDTEYTRGTVAMAKTAFEPPGRSGSQFFIVVGADAGLAPDYALLGEVRATVAIRTITISRG
jgi:cyclophilin family peptidyl-prolyl cis-trans isomerase